MSRAKRGLTLVELLAVTAVVSALIAMFLPAVQGAREAARRMQCKNNLRQLGIAMHGYCDAHGTLPPQFVGAVAQDAGNPATIIPISATAPAAESTSAAGRFGWAVFILPHLEQQALYDEINPGANRFDDSVFDAARIGPLQARLEIFRCPSDIGAALNDDRPFVQSGSGRVALLARSNYPGCGGNDANTGIIAANRAVRLQQIRDGLGATIFIGERATPSGRLGALWGGISQSGGVEVSPEAVRGLTLYRMNLDSADNGSRPQAAFSSLHPGGAQFLFGDGSVKFLAESIDWTAPNVRPLGLYNRLGAMSDGQPVGAL